MQGKFRSLDPPVIDFIPLTSRSFATSRRSIQLNIHYFSNQCARAFDFNL